MKALITFLSLIAMAALAGADETTCPASKAAEAGYSPFETLHKVIAPLWHDAWPSKDYQTLLAAGEGLEAAYVAVGKLNPQTGNKNRLERFGKHRTDLAEQVKLYTDACQRKDKDAVHKILPNLHESFEAAAAELMPIPYPEIESISITSVLIVSEHLPNERIEGLVGSTATLVRKVEYLTEESIPKELAEQKSELLEEFTHLKNLAGQMDETCDAKSLEKYRDHAEELNKRIQQIISTYL